MLTIIAREAKRSFATHSDLSFEIRAPKRNLKAWSTMLWTLFEILQQLSIEFFRKKISKFTGSHTQKVDEPIKLFQVTNFPAESLRNLVNKQRQNEQVAVTGSHIRKFDLSIRSLQVVPLCRPMFKKFCLYFNYFFVLRKKNQGNLEQEEL